MVNVKMIFFSFIMSNQEQFFWNSVIHSNRSYHYIGNFDNFVQFGDSFVHIDYLVGYVDYFVVDNIDYFVD